MQDHCRTKAFGVGLRNADTLRSVPLQYDHGPRDCGVGTIAHYSGNVAFGLRKERHSVAIAMKQQTKRPILNCPAEHVTREAAFTDLVD